MLVDAGFQKGSNSVILGGATIAGFFASACSLPFDFVKTRIQKMQPLPDGTYPYKVPCFPDAAGRDPHAMCQDMPRPSSSSVSPVPLQNASNGGIWPMTSTMHGRRALWTARSRRLRRRGPSSSTRASPHTASGASYELPLCASQHQLISVVRWLRPVWLSCVTCTCLVHGLAFKRSCESVMLASDCHRRQRHA